MNNVALYFTEKPVSKKGVIPPPGGKEKEEEKDDVGKEDNLPKDTENHNREESASQSKPWSKFSSKNNGIKNSKKNKGALR